MRAATVSVVAGGTGAVLEGAGSLTGAWALAVGLAASGPISVRGAEVHDATAAATMHAAAAVRSTSTRGTVFMLNDRPGRLGLEVSCYVGGSAQFR